MVHYQTGTISKSSGKILLHVKKVKQLSNGFIKPSGGRTSLTHAQDELYFFFLNSSKISEIITHGKYWLFKTFLGVSKKSVVIYIGILRYVNEECKM